MNGAAGESIEPVFRSAVPGIDWPAIGRDGAAHFQALLFQMERSQWLSPAQLGALQLRQLRPLLRHALATVPHYAGTLRGLDIDRLDWEAFRALPLLTRQDLQAGFEQLGSSAVPPGHGKVTQGQSSGSTGTPVRFLQTSVTQLFWNVLTLREHLWHQRHFGGKFAAIRTKVEDGRWPDWGIPVAPVFHTGPAVILNLRTDVARQLDWLAQEDPDYLIAKPSNLAALAELALRHGRRLPGLRQARSYGEVLQPAVRSAVRAAWNVEVADTYSCEETGYVALQCPRHEHYHAQSENVLVEVLDEAGRPCGPGETGRVFLTLLHNFAMPLIRYGIGDYAEVGAPCDCGRGLPVITRIHGRLRNMIVLPDGRRHWPSFPAEMWSAVAPIRQFRLIQRHPENIEINYVMDRDLTPDERSRLESALAERFGHRFRMAWKRVDAVQRGPGYKFEDFVSELPPG